jgi:uncharacterized membrane protein (UPF0127 family)
LTSRAAGEAVAGSGPGEAGPGGGRGLLVARNLDRDTVLAERVEVAGSLWGKFRGLMGRAELPAGAGLWLPDSNGIHMMFMRFPIDAVFLGRPGPDGVREVVSVRPSLAAWRGGVPRRTGLVQGRRASWESVHRPYMRYLAGKRLTTHEKNEKKNTMSLFAGVWRMTGWNAMNCSMQTKPNRIHSPNRMLLP